MTWIGPFVLALMTAVMSTATSVTGAVAGPVEPTQARLADLTLEQKVGQLFMVGVPIADADTTVRDLVTRRHVGNIMLAGRSAASQSAVAGFVASHTRLATADATAGIGMLVSVDQEGGAVQVLKGVGFGLIPSATRQGQWTADEVRTRSQEWGAQLRATGVNMNLAPVLDVVPASNVARNDPIGKVSRHFGTDPARVASHGIAAMRGFADAGVVPAVKHFPGLGLVQGNTDYVERVKDTEITATHPYLQPFAEAIAQGAPVVMMSLATYTRIDPEQPAALSPAVVTALLRERLGFTGVVISDSFSAASVRGIDPAQRAPRFIDAGGDLILTNGPQGVAAMYDAVLARARTDAAFAAKVDAAALRVLLLKESQGLL